MLVADLLADHPDPIAVDPATIAEAVTQARRVFIVLDDDPTGTQSVAHLPVLSSWSVDDLSWAIGTGAPAVYVLTNSRSLSADDAERINREVVGSALAAAEKNDVEPVFVSRSDSTLRGHFPLETDVIADTLRSEKGTEVDGVILVPAFPDAGRITIDGVHGLDQNGTFLPAGDSEFAQDSTFGYTSSKLADWVEEKSAGAITAESVVVLDLGLLRSGPEAVAERIASAPQGSVIASDIVVEDDARVLAQALQILENAGRHYIYRVGPPFVRARIGQPIQPPVEAPHLIDSDATPGGLTVVGSHVGLTSLQLARLIADHPQLTVVELNVPELLDEKNNPDRVVKTALAEVIAGFDAGNDVVLHTSRALIRTEDPDESLAISRRVSEALVQIVRGCVDARPVRYVIAKGGITSSDIATRALGIARAWVTGSLFEGIVSVWSPVSGPAEGIPYIVFAGNVGNEESLSQAVSLLSGTP